MLNTNNYTKKIIDARYFIFHLVKWDLKYRFRRSKLGILWTVLQPLFLTLIISFVFGTIFNIPMLDYAPYILSGFLVWDVILGAVIAGSFGFIKAESYIKQFAHPAVIYPIRESLVLLSTFMIAMVSLFIWVGVVAPENLVIGIMSLPLTLLLLFLLSLAISTIASHIHVRYRDYPYVLGLVMQFLWYLSPVFFQESMFKMNSSLHKMFLYNPITSMLLLVRDPFLYGRFPSFFAYAYVLLIIVLLMFIALFVNKRCEKDVIFYL